jgi:hypothetical protein
VKKSPNPWRHALGNQVSNGVQGCEGLSDIHDIDFGVIFGIETPPPTSLDHA